jgi:aryl-alcohol dehydrogenase-like predicted oxidoreductase
MLKGLSGASAFAAAAGLDPNVAGHAVKFHDGTVVAALGQGSWHLGQGRHPEAVEEEALRTGLSLGMTLIDTAEGYSNGRSEELIGRVIAGQRDRVFLVSKVDHMRTGDAIARACEASLARLGTGHLDLYLAHWRDRGNAVATMLSRLGGNATVQALSGDLHDESFERPFGNHASFVAIACRVLH